jgi:serine/threonine protein kinase
MQNRVRKRMASRKYKRYLCVCRKWRKTMMRLMKRSDDFRLDLLHRMLSAARSTTAKICPNDVQLSLLGYTIGTKGLISAPENVQMLGRPELESRNNKLVRHVDGLTFPFWIWKNVKAPKWSVLSKGLIQRFPFEMGCGDMYLVTHQSTSSLYFARIVHLQDKPVREGVVRELDAHLRLRTRLRKMRMEANLAVKQKITQVQRRIQAARADFRNLNAHVAHELDAEIKMLETEERDSSLTYSHLYVVPVSISVDAVHRPPHLVLVFEPEDTNLLQLTYPVRSMPEVVLASVVHQLMIGLKHLHETGLVHSGLDASAVFISFSGRVRLGEMNHAYHADDAKCRGKIEIMAPERLLGLENTSKGDIWSLGLMMLKVLACLPLPFGDPNKDLLAYKRTICSIADESSGAYAPKLLPTNGPFSAAVRLFVERCLDRHPRHRPTVEDCLAMPFVGKAAERSGRTLAWSSSKTEQAILSSWVQSLLQAEQNDVFASNPDEPAFRRINSPSGSAFSRIPSAGKERES